MYSVTKVIDFCYGHRLPDHDGPCRHLHGHNGRAEIELAADRLDAKWMVCDFHEVKQTLKTWIDQTLDHRMLLHEADPLVAVLREQGEPVVAIPGYPTAEHLARMIYEHAKQSGLPVVAVRLWETPTSFAIYKE